MAVKNSNGDNKEDYGLIPVRGQILLPSSDEARAIRFVQSSTLAGTNSQSALGIDTVPVLDMAHTANLPEREDGKPTEAELKLINALSPRPVKPESIYCLDCSPSTQRVDSHLTRMDITSVRNYMADANNGTPVMNSHRTGGWSGYAELPVGKSHFAVLDGDPQLPGGMRFLSSFYLRRGSTSTGINVDSIIQDIEAGIITDISIGFYQFRGTPALNFEDRTKFICSVCDCEWSPRFFWFDDDDDDDWAGGTGEKQKKCKDHWPGQLYPKTQADGGKRNELCYLNVVNARLAEFSMVYGGSTPGAVILKARQAAESGQLERSFVRSLEDTYGVRLTPGYTQFAAPEPLRAKAKDTPALAGGNPVSVPVPVKRENPNLEEEQVTKEQAEQVAKEADKSRLKYR